MFTGIVKEDRTAQRDTAPDARSDEEGRADRPVRILHLDHDRESRQAVAILLVRSSEVTVWGTADVDEARSLLGGGAWDFVLVDQAMPEAGGVDFLREVKQLQPSAYRLLLTEHPEDSIVRDGWQEGVVQSVVLKPIDPDGLGRALGVRSEPGGAREATDGDERAVGESPATTNEPDRPPDAGPRPVAKIGLKKKVSRPPGSSLAIEIEPERRTLDPPDRRD